MPLDNRILPVGEQGRFKKKNKLGNSGSTALWSNAFLLAKDHGLFFQVRKAVIPALCSLEIWKLLTVRLSRVRNRIISLCFSSLGLCLVKRGQAFNCGDAAGAHGCDFAKTLFNHFKWLLFLLGSSSIRGSSARKRTALLCFNNLFHVVTSL